MHTALDIPIVRGDGYRAQEMSQDRKLDWASKKFLVIDEFHRMDSIALQKLDQQLHSVRPETTDPFGGFHVVFVGDFLQLPAVSGLYIYISRANRLVCQGLYSGEKLTLPSRSSNTCLRLSQFTRSQYLRIQFRYKDSQSSSFNSKRA